MRATHFMRTTPLSLWSKQAEQFDLKICHTVFQCLGLKPVNEAYDQVSVSTKIGGLGIRRIVDHAKGAFTASSKLRLLLASHGSNLTMRTAQQITQLSKKPLPLLM